MILIRADANEVIGTGHVMRCLSIATELSKLNQEVIFVTADDKAKVLIQNKVAGIEVLESDYASPINEINSVEHLINRYKPSAILVDSYYIGQEYLLRIKASCITAYIDDMQSDLYPCDILIHYGVTGDELRTEYVERYKNAGIKCPELLLGTRFAPLREEFKRKETRKIRKKVQNILILTGGADISHTGLEIAKYLIEHSEFNFFNFTFVLGRLNTDAFAIRELTAYCNNILLRSNVENISSLMNEADIAISAGGTTLLELCSCGVPIIAYTCADNQTAGTRRLSDQTGFIYTGDSRETPDLVEKIFYQVLKLSEDYPMRQDVSLKEQAIVDGLGACRIARSIVEY